MKKIDPFPGVLKQRFVERPFMTKTGKNGCQRMKAFVLTDEQQAWLCKWFPEIENARLMEASGMSHSTLHRLARDLGLTKSEKGIRGIKKRQAAHIRKVCEKNGKLWVTFDGAPVVPEDMLNGDIREITNKLRKKYVEENLKQKEI